MTQKFSKWPAFRRPSYDGESLQASVTKDMLESKTGAERKGSGCREKGSGCREKGSGSREKGLVVFSCLERASINSLF
jgi:hypothetical protein